MLGPLERPLRETEMERQSQISSGILGETVDEDQKPPRLTGKRVRDEGTDPKLDLERHSIASEPWGTERR